MANEKSVFEPKKKLSELAYTQIQKLLKKELESNNLNKENQAKILALEEQKI